MYISTNDHTMHEITRYLHTYIHTYVRTYIHTYILLYYSYTGQHPSGSKNTILNIRMQHATTYFVNHEKLITF